MKQFTLSHLTHACAHTKHHTAMKLHETVTPFSYLNNQSRCLRQINNDDDDVTFEWKMAVLAVFVYLVHHMWTSDCLPPLNRLRSCVFESL